jgi:hypothetical protein
MDLTVLKKKLSVFRNQDGLLKNISDELLYELLASWEAWDGSSKEFYSALGTTASKMAPVIGRAKRYKREGRFGSSEFKEVVVEGQEEGGGPGTGSTARSSCCAIEYVWPDGRIVRFSDLGNFLEFIKKSA